MSVVVRYYNDPVIVSLFYFLADQSLNSCILLVFSNTEMV